MTDNQPVYKPDDLFRLITALGDFLEKECAELCCDDEADRGTLAAKVAAWLLKDKTINITPELVVPKATYRLSLNIVDEPTGEHIVRLTLNREPMMADGDFLQLQNFFWCTIGRGIRDSVELRRTLQAAGIIIETDLPEQPGSAQMGG